MKIGVDIDNVISNFDDALMAAYLEHGKELGGKGAVNANASSIRRGMFDWSEEEEQAFYDGNIERVAKTLGVIEGAKEYLDKLRADGHEIYIITARANSDYTEPHGMTKEWLARHGICYDVLILTDSRDRKGKTPVCLQHGIDVMIDDSVHVCMDCLENGVPAVLMDTWFNRDAELKRVTGWKDFYGMVSSWEESGEIHIETI